MRKVIVLMMMVSGLFLLSESLYLLSKAWLSQTLIANAWQSTVSGDKYHKPWPWADTYPVAKLEVPVLSVSSYILEGSSGRNLAFAPAHLPQSGMPGEFKSTVISGHNDTHFSYLQKLKKGDQLNLTTMKNKRVKTHTYYVVEIDIMDSKSQKINIIDKHELILTTCYPFSGMTGQTDLRYVIKASPV